MSTRLVAYVGSYGGGIHLLDVDPDGRRLTVMGQATEPAEAGYLVYAPTLSTLYAVDERKTDGRGPAGPAASVHALAVDCRDGNLTWLNSRTAPGPFPTYLSVDESRRLLVTANHGSFEHVERVIRTADGGWTVEYVYDDSTVILYDLQPDGRVGDIRDLHVMTGHGPDPNGSPQAGGHGQASAHAHSAVIDPSGGHLLVGDKGTDRILVFRLAAPLEIVSTYQFPAQTGPRHIAFDPDTGRAFVTCEFSSELASFDFDPDTGQLRLLDKRSTVHSTHTGLNEPADLRVHPHGRFVYVNNRGEDSLAWFAVGADGALARLGHVPLATSVHPGVAARSFAFDPTGTFMLVADRPANLVRSFAVDPDDGALHPLTDMAVQDPAFIAFAELDLSPERTPS